VSGGIRKLAAYEGYAQYATRYLLGREIVCDVSAWNWANSRGRAGSTTWAAPIGITPVSSYTRITGLLPVLLTRDQILTQSTRLM
jgi:hypothetical protein